MTEVSTPRRNPLRTAPNLLTLLRICLAPFLVAAILENRFGLSFALFVAAGLTDALDGLLARVLKQRTMLGQYLDPVADKLLLSTLFLVLMHKGLMPTTVTVLVSAAMSASCWLRQFSMRRWAGGSLAQHLWQGQHAGPGHRGGRGAAASAHDAQPGWLILRLVALDATIGADRGFRPALCVDDRVAPQQRTVKRSAKMSAARQAM